MYCLYCLSWFKWCCKTKLIFNASKIHNIFLKMRRQKNAEASGRKTFVIFTNIWRRKKRQNETHSTHFVMPSKCGTPQMLIYWNFFFFFRFAIIVMICWCFISLLRIAHKCNVHGIKMLSIYLLWITYNLWCKSLWSV